MSVMQRCWQRLTTWQLGSFFWLPGIFLSASMVGAQSFDRGFAGFSVKVGAWENPYRVFAIPVMPSAELPLQVPSGATLETSGGQLTKVKANTWRWRAPVKSRLSTINITSDGQAMRLNIFVMRPASEVRSGKLDGYRIGDYPKQAYRGLEAYNPPEGFIEVPSALYDTELSPHFTLKQFLCKQALVGGKQFMLIRPELLLKLESILWEINQAGFHASTLYIMSGYRTPHYNQAIGNSEYSRHIYGGAADFFIDENPRDGVMDDLNKDGRVDRDDAAFLYRFVETLTTGPGWHIGGLGEYGATSSHGPFVHVDVRGHSARWGHGARK